MGNPDNSLFDIFRHFGATYRNLWRLYHTAEPPFSHFKVLFKANLVSEEKKLCYFIATELNDALEELNSTVIQNMESTWWFPKQLILHSKR